MTLDISCVQSNTNLVPVNNSLIVDIKGKKEVKFVALFRSSLK